jgi:hypothetical protein
LATRDLRSALLSKEIAERNSHGETDVALVEQRFRTAQADYEVRYGKARK